MWPALFQVTKLEVVWLRHHLAMPRPAQLSPGSIHFTYIVICIRYFANGICELILLFCSVHVTSFAWLGRGVCWWPASSATSPARLINGTLNQHQISTNQHRSAWKSCWSMLFFFSRALRHVIVILGYINKILFDLVPFGVSFLYMSSS